MKKTAIALAISAFAVATAAQAAPQANTFYVGAKAGWASFHDGINQFKYAPAPASDKVVNKVQRNHITYGVFGGYQITDNFAVELGYDDFGRVKIKANDVNPYNFHAKHTNHGAHLSLKASYPIYEGLDVYARAGVALIRSDYNIKLDDANATSFHGKKLQTSGVFAGGLEYAIIPELALRLEYQWVNNVGKLDDHAHGKDYRPDISSVSLGLSYRFGQNKAPVVEIVNQKINLDAALLFDFDKANLKKGGAEYLDAKYNEVNAKMTSVKGVDVAGYTDRIGNANYNLKLSQKRAETVANYLVSKGVAPELLTATGYGKANPATGNKCDAVKGRKALIECLAPDRRVEITVKGDRAKKVVM